MSQTMKNIKLLDCVIKHGFIYELSSPHDLVTLFTFSSFNAQPHSYWGFSIIQLPVRMPNVLNFHLVSGISMMSRMKYHIW